MSKSKGNSYTLTDLLNKGYAPEAIRYEIIKAHYRQRMDFNESNMAGNQTVIDRLGEFLRRLTDVKGKNGWDGLQNAISRAEEAFERGLDDDLNMSVALAGIFEFMTDVNKHFDSLSEQDAKQITDLMRRFDTVLAVMPQIKEETLAPELQALIDKRQQFRMAKDWAQADALKQELLSKGIEVKDTPAGPVWRKL